MQHAVQDIKTTLYVELGVVMPHGAHQGCSLLSMWQIVADLAAKPYARESHSRGLSLRSFDASAGLKGEYEVLSLSTDPEGEVR